MDNVNTPETVVKTRETAGADERTPSRAQYFSWINNTNEGSTEEHTLINLEYFKWLHDEFGMQLDIYAWDAGNLDGSEQTYQSLGSEKLRAQYPRGYAPIAEKAREMGIKLGVWCGPDGFGDTPEEEAARREQMVSLCRDFNFGLFKMDAVCGGLREEKQEVFIEMMKECRRYSPELILLNHRLELGRGMPYATTTLLDGRECYIDVNMFNRRTAPHHREFMFHLWNPDELTRLTEDHGVCLSSCIDYFEDELMLQAFRRSLILAPEIYGSPWFLRDDEHARLARIFNLHRTYRDILVDGLELPRSYNLNGTARGNGEVMLLTLGNPSWETSTVKVKLDGEIGLVKRDGAVAVSLHHPYEKHVGIFAYGDEVDITVDPFRAVLVEVAYGDKAYPMLTGCCYEVLHETSGVPDRVKILQSDGNIGKLVAGVYVKAPTELGDVAAFDNREKVPVAVDFNAERGEIPADIRRLYEASQFATCNDSLEARTAARSGETSIPQVKAARDAFFSQRTYMARGCESRFAFDGRPDTYFDGFLYGGGIYHDGGSLRVDFGDVYDADSLIIEYFDPGDDSLDEMKFQTAVPMGTASADLCEWTDSYLDSLTAVSNEVMDTLITCVHNIVPTEGVRRRAVYSLKDKIKYFRLPKPYHHVYKIALVKSSREIPLRAPRVLNMMPLYESVRVEGYRSGYARVPGVCRDGSYLSIAVNDITSHEGVYVVAELDGRLYGCPDRAPSYPGNAWESPISRYDDEHPYPYTFYLPIEEEMKGRELKLHVIEMSRPVKDGEIGVYVCESHDDRDGVVKSFN